MILNGTHITMTRGDSETITVNMRNRDGEQVSFVDGDIIYMTVKDNLKTDEKIFQKMITEFTDGKADIDILPEDTSDIRVKSYVYDIQLTREDGSVTTIIKPSDLTIEGDVTRE